MWPAFGFDQNPYDQQTLRADEEGDYLLVGRDDLSQQLQMQIGTDGSHATVEGPVGVGKSSLVEVSVYRMYVRGLQSALGELFVPAVRRIQPMSDPDSFKAETYRILAETLIRYADHFASAGLSRPSIEELDQWLNSPQYSSWQAGGGFATLSASGGYGEEGNTGSGFEKSGFPSAVRGLLAQAYAGGEGAIVIVLDNFELLETVALATRALDSLRDEVFTSLSNVRWVVAGSRGLIARARTDRLSSFFARPIRVPPLTADDTVTAIARRIERRGSLLAQAPVTPDGFRFVYEALNENLRAALAASGEFAQLLYRDYLNAGLPLPHPDERDVILTAWLTERAKQAREDAAGVQDRTWQFFEELCSAGGSAGSSEHEAYGFTKQPGMVRAVTQLAQANLVVREMDTDSGARTLNVVTAEGWLVHRFRESLGLPPARAVPS